MTGNPDQPLNPTSDNSAADSATARLEREWAAVVGDLQAHQRAWLQASKPVTLHGSTAIVAVPDDFTRKRLEGRLRGQLEDTLTERFGHEVQLAVTVDSSLQHVPAATGFPAERYDDGPAYEPASLADVAPIDMSTSPQIDSSTYDASRTAPAFDDGYAATDRPAVLPAPGASPPATGESRLNPKYTFETFVIGSSNRFPHAAAVAVSRGAGQGLQPALHLRRVRAGQDPPPARDRPLRAHASTPASKVRYVISARSSPTTSSTRSATTGRTELQDARTATWTCC